jgi:AbrB family looped-hinge helix DNA binding protein
MPSKNATKCRLAIDKAGRVVIPKNIRKAFHLHAGDSLEMETSGDQITLRPLRSSTPLIKERGVWVLRTGEPLLVSEADDVLRRIRDERDMQNSGIEE